MLAKNNYEAVNGHPKNYTFEWIENNFVYLYRSHFHLIKYTRIFIRQPVYITRLCTIKNIFFGFVTFLLKVRIIYDKYFPT
jgi:hypothetical protein